MTVIGFDVSKKELIGVRLDKNLIIKESFKVENTKPAIQSYLLEIKSRFKHPLISSESTAEYHKEIALSCIEVGIPFKLLNPILTKQFTRATVRKKKTDLTDAEIIARLTSQGEGRLVTKADFNTNKVIIRTSNKLASMSQAFSLMCKRMDYHHPNQKEVYSILQECNKTIDDSIKKLRKLALKNSDKDLICLLKSIPGIGDIIAADIAAEIGDINRFNSPKSLVAFTGLDPKVRQSGISLNHNTKLTKRGSSNLRRSLFIAASVARQHDSELKAYYEKKRSEGRTYTEAMVATTRKLINRVYAVWKRKKPYEKR